ncbi:MAG: hypothetical protein WCL11_22665, partial [Verrucomicrobiota bacterium]
TESVANVTGTPVGAWTYDEENGFYNDYGYTDYAIRVYAYRNVVGGRVYSPSYAQSADTPGPVNNDEAMFYFTWTWDAVPGADGYRVLSFNSDMGYFYNQYWDVDTNSLIDGDGQPLWQYLSAPVGPFSRLTHSHIHESLAVDGVLTVADSLAVAGESTTLSLNVTSVSGYKFNGQTVMRFVNNGSPTNTYFGVLAGSLSTEPTCYGNIGIGGYSIGALTTGNQNIALGNSAGSSLTNSAGNILIGYNCAHTMNAGNTNVFIGTGLGGEQQNLGSTNVCIGAGIMQHNDGGTIGSGNVILGANAGNRQPGSYNIFIGYGAGSRENGSNKVIVDYAVRASTTDEKENAIIYGNTAVVASQTLRLNARVGIRIDPTAYMTLPAGSAAAGTAPVKFTSGTLTTAAVAGQMEYLTNDFYLTSATGVREKVATAGAGLTSGRVAFVTTNGRLTDSANLTWNGSTFAIIGGVTVTTTLGVTGAATFSAQIKLAAYTVNTLPSASTAGAFATAGVTDALLPAIGSTVATGGAIKCVVMSNGTNWIVNSILP